MQSWYTCVVAVALVSCKGKEQHGAHAVASDAAAMSADARPVAAAGARTPGTLVAAGPLRDAKVFDAYAVLIPPGGRADKARAAAQATAKQLGLDAQIEVGDVGATGFDLDLLPYFGRDLADADVAKLAKVTAAVTIAATGTGAATADVLHGAAAVARAGAAAARGWILDRVTSETFTRDSFDQRRPDGFPLDVKNLIVVHVVANDDSTVFFESFGLVRFGLPELFVRSVPQSFSADTFELVDAAAQLLVEHGGVDRDGELTVHGPAGAVTFTAAWTLGDNADDPDALPEIELSVPGDTQALYAALQTYFGHHADEIHGAKANDPELEAASKRAMQELAALAPHFAAGIPEREKLLVKAPFTTTSGGDEYMWIEVHAWKGDRLVGILLNEPSQVPTLKVGAQVEVAQADLFDYLHVDKDGNQVGGETDRILQAREQ